MHLEDAGVTCDATTISQRSPRGAGVSVADATVREAVGAVLDFRVSLTSPAAGESVTTDYATADGTAKAGEDYTAASGTITFASGERHKTIRVAVLDDAVDEGAETLALRLLNASGAVIADGVATGTIVNSGLVQKMWLSRFGRTVAGQVVDAVAGRLSGPPGGSRATLGGQSIDLLAAGGGEAGGPGYAAWGRLAAGGFDAEAPTDNGGVRLDAEVTTGIFGADVQWERWLAGLALSVSEGEGEATFDEPGRDSGTVVESTLTGVNPYVRYEASDRLTAWGLLGYGTGDMTIGGKSPERTDISMRLGAAGARGVLLEAGETGGVDLALRGDAFLAQMDWEKVSNETDTRAEASRLRLVLEAGRSFALGPGAVLAPALELGLRHDGGDAETGTGVEAGGRIRFADAGSGLTVEANARTLVAHEDSDYREWGAGGSVRLGPNASGRGLSLALSPVWGTPSSGVERLLSARDAAGLPPGGEFERSGVSRARSATASARSVNAAW